MRGFYVRYFQNRKIAQHCSERIAFYLNLTQTLTHSLIKLYFCCSTENRGW